MKRTEDLFQMMKAKNTIDELWYIKSFIDSWDSMEDIKKWVETTIDRNKWLIEYIDKAGE